MKKAKLLSGLVMLMLCAAVAVMGIYAITPTTHGIKGTISVAGGAYLVEMQAFLNTTATKLSDPVRARHEREVVNLSKRPIVFACQDAYDADQVDPLKIILRVTNNSYTDLGLYFVEITPQNGETPETKTLVTNQKFSSVGETPEDVFDNVISVDLPGYTRLEAKGTIELEIDITLLRVEDIAYDVEMKLNLQVEEYD